jgi:hypothetical protein
MGTYRKEWDCCGSVTETEAWEPESCPFCTDDAAPFRKDAQRYRWLREHSTEYSLTQKDGYGGRDLLGWDALDAAVDAAMAAPPAVGAA